MKAGRASRVASRPEATRPGEVYPFIAPHIGQVNELSDFDSLTQSRPIDCN